MNKEFSEEELKEVKAGLPHNIASKLKVPEKAKERELTEEELEKVTAGIPRMNDISDMNLPEGTYINEYGEIIREGRSR